MKNFGIFLKQLWALTLPYFKSRSGLWALGFFIFLVALSFVLVDVNVRINQWNNRFYTALQKRDEASFWHESLVFVELGFVYVTIAVLRYVLTQIFQIRWRTWLTNHLLGRWTASSAYYRMQMTHRETDNPDQRIAEDLRQFVESTLNLSLAFISNGATLVSFSFILWELSEPLSQITLGGTTIAIPGVLFWAALVYSALVTFILHKIGRPLARLNFDRERREANFRFDLVRTRENAEAIALYGGGEAERGRLVGRFEEVRRSLLAIVNRQKFLVGVQAALDQGVLLLPYVAMAPVYFTGAVEFGAMTQTAGAFGRVQDGFSWFANFYTSLAEWAAVVQRLTGFVEVLEEAERLEVETQRKAVQGEDWSVDGLEVGLPDGTPLFATSLTLKKGEDLLVTGRSGIGKSTLFRVLADIWPFSRGRIEMPEAALGRQTLFLPQKPYVPVGTLRAAVTYPAPEGAVDDGLLRQALADVDLPDLGDRLDERGHWQARLSGGELQRLAIARALVHRPNWLFMDEATSAMDEGMEGRLYRVIKARLPETTIVSIGHRGSLKAFHDREYHLGEAAAQPAE
ncbi:ABC transporter ATP-binding protein/permease [Zavarzinia sp.]|uniref:ABC transporter ATP-binding protein/permease n=1 Tax=Zavarzinia sp. TaxID=2027920 RepID=UPI003568977D